MRSVEFRPRAAVDIEGIVVYLAYALKMPQAARRTAEELYAAIDRIADNPFSGRFCQTMGWEGSIAASS